VFNPLVKGVQFETTRAKFAALGQRGDAWKMKNWIGIVLALGVGLAGGAVLATLVDRKPAPSKVVAAPLPEPDDGDDNESLMAANANLVTSLQECNRRLAELGQKRVGPAPVESAAPRSSGDGRRGPRPELRAERSAADWDRYSKEGIVPYNVPCIRDTPFAPSQRQLDRFGLAPDDAKTLHDAYAKSNERMLAQLKPLCAQVLGNDKLPDRVGSQACISAIIDGARRDNPDKMQEALTRVGEVNAGKRPRPAGDAVLEPVEALMLAMTTEAKTFESDLAASLGPEDARRVASRMCMDRGTARAKPAPQ
jgi:hypothetical protein